MIINHKSVPSKGQRFLKLPRTEINLFIQTCILSLISSLMVSILPMRLYIKWLGEKGKESSVSAIEGKSMEIFLIEKTMRRIVRHLPWRPKCLSRAITAKILLNRRKISSTIYLGVAKDGDIKMVAHAWLRCGNIIVSGKEEMQKFTPVVFFT